MKPLYILTITTVLWFSCGKKKQEPPPVADAATTGNTPPGHQCGPLPSPPEGYNWVDSTIDVNKNITAFFYNPANSDEVLVVTTGDIQGANRLINVNLRTKSVTHLANLDQYLPSINKQGWILYSDFNNDIFRIKSNGDSLQQLTFTQAAHDPKWDHTGKAFYYFREEFASIPAQLIYSGASGDLLNAMAHNQPYTVPFNRSSKLLILRRQGEKMAVIQSGMNNAAETTLLTGPYYSNTKFHFSNVCIDANDENFYWSNDQGIFSFNLANRTTDTLFKSCENTIYDRPMTGTRMNEITYSKHTIKVVSIIHILHEFKAMEFNTVLGEEREVKVF